MNAPLFNLPLLLLPSAESTGTTGTTGGVSQWGILIVMPLIILVFYFLVMRPQNKKQKEAKKLLENLRKGDRIVTIGGLRGTIVSVKDDAVILKVDDNTKLEYSKNAVSSVLKREEEATTEPAKRGNETSEPTKE